MRRPRVNGSAAAVSVFLVGSFGTATNALADNLSVAAAQTTKVATATASNNSAGDISVTSAGSVIVSDAGPGATINSNNVLTNAGTIGSSAASNATGLLIQGTGLTSVSLVNNGTISVTGASGSNNIGLSVAGSAIAGSITSGLTSAITVIGDNVLGVSVAAPFTGDISLRSVTVSGLTSTAVSITAPITGNLSLVGGTSSTGTGGYGLLVAAAVTGTVRNGGSIAVGSTQVVDTSGNTTPGLIGLAGERISASVGAGLLNDTYYIDSTGAVVPAASVDTTTDTLITGSIITTGTAPALWVAPDATSPKNITIGAVGTGTDAYAIVNRGILQTNIGNTGQSSVALRVGGGGATTTLVGGINSQATGSILAYSLDGSATAVDLLSGASVPTLLNQGILTASATQTAASGSIAAGAGGAAYGVLVEAGATLTSLTNSGTMTVTATGPNNNATAILDRSSTLSAITNTGTITASATGSGGLARAIDLSASTGPVVVTNSGTITGAIVFGSGTSTLALTAGTIVGNIAFGSGTSNLYMSGTSAISSGLTSAAPLNVTLADTASLNLTTGPKTINSISASGSSTLIVPVLAGGTGLVVNGAASFTGNSVIALSLQSLAPDQTFTVVTAAGGITTDHLATLVNPLSAPYLFTSSAPTLTGDTLSVTLVRKTADEIGLTGGQANLFNASIAALPDSSAEAVAISNLGSQAAVKAAYRQITPPSFGRAQLRAAQSFTEGGFGAAADRLAIVDDVRHGGVAGTGVWGQEFGNFGRQSAGDNESAYRSSGFGIAGGIDRPMLGLDALGVALLSSWTTTHLETGSGLPDVKIPMSTLGIEPYASWSWRALFVQAMGLAARVNYDSTRTVTIGSVADSVSAHWNGTQFGAGLTIGARFDLGRFRITPSNSLSWTSLQQGHYTEEGGGNFALDVAKQTDHVTSDTAKLSLAYLQPIGGGTMRVEGHGAYVHQFNPSATETVVNFVSGGDAFTMAGDAPRDKERSYGADIGFRQDMLSVRAGYDRRQSSGYHDQSFAVTAGLLF